MDGPASFGAWVRQQRKALDLTQDLLAERAGCSSEMIRKIEAGRARPSRQLAELLVRALGVSVADRERVIGWARTVSPTPVPTAKVVDGASAPPMETPLTNLPTSLTALVGRDPELAQSLALLAHPDVRLLTLTGPPGVGKTRLALQVASNLQINFAGEVWFIALAAVTDVETLIAAIAGTLSVRPEPGRPLLPTVQTAIRGRQLLIVLDNFEHIAAAGASVLGDLLGGAPDLKLLVTSRVRLHLRGERELALAPLQLPPAAAPLNPSVLAGVPAVALFVERAAEAQTGFMLTTENAPAVAAICRRLDGLPLALELAAARSKILSPAALLARLDTRLSLLTYGAGDLPAHQQTLRDTITWSYNLLDPATQELFCCLAVFAGGCTLAAAEAICAPANGTAGQVLLHPAPVPPAEVLEGIAQLVDQSLLQRTDDPTGETRFTMLETIHEYAEERLRESTDAAEVRERHATYYLALAEAADRAWSGPEQMEWAERLEVEHDNLRAALDWAEETGRRETGARLAGALARFWATHGFLDEARRRLAWALQPGSTLPAPLRARVLDAASEIAYWQADYAAARAWAEDGLSLRRALGQPVQIADALTNLGRILWRLGDPAAAQALLTESQVLRRALGTSPGSAETRHPSTEV